MMDRSREPRRVNNMAAGNGLTKRRHRSGGTSHRESPEDDAQVDLHESGGRLRDRVPGKKERERDRDRDRSDLDRDRAMMMMMTSGGSRSKRRRADRLFVHQNNNLGGGRHFSGEDSSEESINEDEEEDDEKNEAMRMLPPHNPSNHSSIVSSSSSPHHLSSKKNFSQPLLPAASAAQPVTPGVKPVRSPTPTATSTPPSLPPPWASGEMIGVSVPRKARSASTKRSYECRASGGGFSANDRNTSNSPGQSSGPSVPPSAVSPSNVAAKKKMKSTAPKQKPSKSNKSLPSTQDDIEFEIAEVLYGLKRQPQCPAKTDNAPGNDAVRKEAESSTVRLDGETKSRVSSPTHLSHSSVSTIVPKRKRPRPVKYEDENPASLSVRSSSNQSTLKAESDFIVHAEPSSAKSETAVETGGVSLSESHVIPAEETNAEHGKAPISESEAREKHVSVKKEEPRSPSKIEPEKTQKTITPFEPETQREKLEIDLMSPPSKLTPELESESSTIQAAVAKENVENYEKPRKLATDENEFKAKEGKLDLHIDLERDDSKHHQHGLKLQPPEKSASSSPNSIPVPMSIAGWPHVGYMAPLQGVVSMDANALPSPALQNRLKRCATHCKIARNIHYHQQFSRMSPFWPGSTLPYGGKLPVPNANPVLDKAPVPAVSGKEKNPISAPASSVDAAQRKQILIRQPIPPGGPSNILHGPAFIFPLSQQQPNAAAGGARPVVGTASAVASASSAAAMNFSYPNMGPSEAPYLAILQNGAYSIPVPTHMGSAPAYRGAHPQPMPFYNGSFYSSQIIHPSQLQQPQPPTGQPPPSQRMLTPAQKPLQNPPQKSIVPQNFSASKNHTSQPLQFQQRQPAPTSNAPVQTQTGDNVTDEDGRMARSNGGVYGQNFVVPIHPSNFAFMSQAAIAGTINEKKQQPPAAAAGKVALDSMQSPAFAMSFASINGGTTAAGFDISIAQNPALLQTLPEAARHGFHFMQAQAKGKPGDEEDRKSNAGSSIAFTRPDVTEASVSNLTGSTIPPAAANSPHPPQLQRVSQQMIQQQKHHQQFAVSTPARSKAPTTSNGNVFPDQWKNSSRTSVPQIRPPQQNHAQISFGGNPKTAPTAGNTNPNTNHQSPPLVPTGSPTTSKSAGGSPRTAEKKTAPSAQPQKSTAANGSRNVPSILGLQAGGSKLGLPNTHIYSGPYMPPQAHAAASSNKAAGGFYMHRQRGEPQPQVKGSASSSSHGMLSLCPPVGSEQGKKGGSVSYGQFAVPQATSKQHQVGFGYAHGGVHVKQGGDQKQPAGE